MLFVVSSNMLFKKNLRPDEYEIVEEGKEDVMRINCFGTSYAPSIEDDPLCMARTIDKLIQVPSVSRIVLDERRTYTYDEEQTLMLREIANLYNFLVKQKKVLQFSSMGISLEYTAPFAERLANIQYVLTNLLRTDPIGAYVELKRLIREQKIRLQKTKHPFLIKDIGAYLNLLTEIYDLLNKSKLIQLTKPYLEGYEFGDRSLYRSVFKPAIAPDFLFTRLMAEPPIDGIVLDSYNLKDSTNVTIFKTPNDIKYKYHLSPPEFNISEDNYELLDLAKTVLAEHKPRAEEFTDIERIRQTFFNIGKDLITELANQKRIEISYEEVEQLAKILVRYTVGFGLIEVLLSDEKVQDVVINGPIGETPIFVVHQDFDECVTNIIPSKEDGEGWATKFRIMSGRPLDEANPVLDTELVVPGARARVAAITNPLNPVGLGYALRRHRDMPWTLPLFIDNKMISPLGAALISFFIDGSRTILVAGTRSSGKSSFLGSCMVEIMRKYRIITLEDTLELPVSALRKLGYNIQPMKVRAALSAGGAEMAAEEGIRTSLRMGDSSLIVGEVRSKEALALYEAMRVGALANVVAGTIHGDSPYGVFDRVVNDLGVPRTSFKATDIIIIANPIKTADGLHKVRRIVSITEVRKDWEKDPLREKAFIDLMKYNAKTDKLEPTDALINGESDIIKAVAGNVKEWAGDWNAVWENIILRAKIKETLVKYANKIKRKDLLESGFVIQSNDVFHRISDDIRERKGFLDSKLIYQQWYDWLKKQK